VTAKKFRAALGLSVDRCNAIPKAMSEHDQLTGGRLNATEARLARIGTSWSGIQISKAPTTGRFRKLTDFCDYKFRSSGKR
jgi:hypothetical protein